MAGWRTLKVFLSSTFRDMHAERDHLVKVVFPALRVRLLPFRVELYDIDLRWGITEEESKSEKVISLCLDQIGECELFLAFIGHRYGWIPKSIPDQVRARFPFVEAFPGASVTELELRHNKARDPAQTYSLVLLRKEDALGKVPEPVKARDFLDEKPEAKTRVEELRKELEKEREHGPQPAQPYSAEWEPLKYDRVNREYGRLGGLDYFGMLAEEWLWDAVKAYLNLPATPPEVAPLDAEADLHERFLETRTRIYIGRDDVYRRLAEFALAYGETPLLLTGESGLGKSAAMARFVRDFRAEHPSVFVLPHFVGASPRTTSLTGMLKRLTEELQRKFTLTLPKAESSDEIIRGFLAALAAVPPSARVVLVFDAVNQLDADSRAESLVWLPERLPPNVRVLCSSATGPQTVLRVLAAFADRPHEPVPLEPLADGERREIVKAVPKLVAKTLDGNQIDALLSNPATRNPLYLVVALEELRGFGSYERLPGMMARFPRGGDAVTKLFDQVFERLEDEFNAPLVDWTLRLLACSRRGLSGPELETLTGHLGTQADDLYPVLRQLRPYLQSRDGLFDFYHLSVRRAAEMRYLKRLDEDDQRDPWARWNPQRLTPAADPTGPEVEARERLVEFFGKERLAADFGTDDLKTPRSVDELPWQLCQLKAWPRLAELFSEPKFFMVALAVDRDGTRTAWALAKSVGGQVPVDVYRKALANPEGWSGIAMWSVASFLLSSGDAVAAGEIWSLLIDYSRAIGDDSHLEIFLGNHAMSLRFIGAKEIALKALEEQEAICRRLGKRSSLQTCLGNQGLLLQAMGRPDEAAKRLLEQEVICREIGDHQGLCRYLINRAKHLVGAGDPRGAIRLLEEQEQIARRIGSADGLQAGLVARAFILKDANDLPGAGQLLAEAETICRRLNDPAALQLCLGNRAEILKRTGDIPSAMHLWSDVESICRGIQDQLGVVRSLGAQAGILTDQGHWDDALTLNAEAAAIAERLNDFEAWQSTWITRARIFTATGNLPEAILANRRALEATRSLNDRRKLPSLLIAQASLLDDLGDPRSALECLTEAEAICREIDDPDALGSALGAQAMIWNAVGDTARALSLLALSADQYNRLPEGEGLATSLRNLGMILMDVQQWVPSLQIFSEYEALANRLGDADGQATALSRRATILGYVFHRRDEALAMATTALDIARNNGLHDLAGQIEAVIHGMPY